MLKYIALFIIATLILSGCAINIHTADRAVMLDEKEVEVLTYVGGNLGGGINTEYNIGLGLGAKVGLADRVTFGAIADLNYNSTKADWTNHIFYGQFAIEQKFSIVKDLFAIKFKEGVFLNNYFGTVKLNSTTGHYEFVERETVIPYLSPSLLYSPEGRLNKKWQLTIGLNSSIGLRYSHTPWTIGGSLLFDYSGDKEKFLTGFVLGGGVQTIVKDGGVAYFSLGFFFSSFKRNKTSMRLQ